MRAETETVLKTLGEGTETALKTWGRLWCWAVPLELPCSFQPGKDQSQGVGLRHLLVRAEELSQVGGAHPSSHWHCSLWSHTCGAHSRDTLSREFGGVTKFLGEDPEKFFEALSLFGLKFSTKRSSLRLKTILL